MSAALVLGALLCLGLGSKLQHGHGDWTPLRRALLCALPLCLFAISVWVASTVASIPFSDWSGARLASSAGLLQGYRLYYGPDEGPAMPTVYGPVSVLLYLPALLSRSINGAMLWAGAINVLCMLVPLLALHASGLREAGWSRVAALLGFAFAAAACFAASPTASMLGTVHVDAPTVGLGLMSCVVLLRAKAVPSAPVLALSVLLAVLAVWTKQIEAPLILALLAWVALRFGAQTLRLQVACFAGIGLLVSAALVIAFDFEAMLFNLFTIPNGHLQNFGVDGAALSFLDLALQCAPFALGIAALAWSLRQASGSWRERDWVLPLLAALLLFPVSGFARAKLGAWENSYHALYYLIAGASLVLAEGLRSSVRFVAPLAATLLAVAYLMAAQSGPGWRGLEKLAALASSPQQQAFAFASAHPGEAYFPWHPLATAWSEGRLYHFDYAVLDRHFAGYRMSDAHFRAFVPPELRYVIFPRDRQDEAVMNWLPEFRARSELAELPGWIVYQRLPSAPGDSSVGASGRAPSSWR